MIHRALFGSFERFIGILLEHLDGDLPAWLAPVQAIVLPIADRQNEAAAAALAALLAAGLRGELDDRSESVGRKIREAELRKVPYMLVVGRARGRGGHGRGARAQRRRHRSCPSASSSRELARRASRALAALRNLAQAARPRYTRLTWLRSNTAHAAQRSPLDART